AARLLGFVRRPRLETAAATPAGPLGRRRFCRIPAAREFGSSSRGVAVSPPHEIRPHRRPPDPKHAPHSRPAGIQEESPGIDLALPLPTHSLRRIRVPRLSRASVRLAFRTIAWSDGPTARSDLVMTYRLRARREVDALAPIRRTPGVHDGMRAAATAR